MTKPLPLTKLRSDPALRALIDAKLARLTPHGLLTQAPAPRPLFIARVELAEYVAKKLYNRA